jgi:hypothetical protein
MTSTPVVTIVPSNGAISPAVAPDPQTNISYARLRKLNRIATVLHGLQFLFMFSASIAVERFKEFKLRLTYSFFAYDPISKILQNSTATWTTIPIGPFIAMFFFLSALFQGLTTVGNLNATYNRDLLRAQNRFRWYEYALSSSLMICIIAMFTGISDIATLILMFTCNGCMCLFGLLMEAENSNQPSITWRPFWFGCISGFPPWIAIFISLGAGSEPPAFVYGIFIGYFIMFQLFPLNMILQYKRIGKWKDYMYGELTYIILSLVAKSFLGWLVFGGLNQPNEFSQ